jgi:Tfp pilus assembly protein PilX
MNYEAEYAVRQHGAVLIFSLIMLLLLTLTSVAIIQQNNQELAMTGNVLDQTKSFASAETELGLAENYINTQRLNAANLVDMTCNRSAASQFIVSATPFFTGTGNATITAVYCLTGGTTETQCETGNLNDMTSAACTCADLKGTEIYDVKWVSATSGNYSSQRVLESKFAVNCSGGSF